jgi:hypothetical protein
MKTLKQFLFTLALMVTMLSAVSLPAFAQSNQTSISNSLLPPSENYSSLPQVAGDTGEQKFYNLVTAVIMNVRYIIGAVAIGLMVYAGVRMVIAQGSEEEYTTQKRNLVYAVIGLAVVGFSGDLVRIFSVYCSPTGKDLAGMPCTPGGFLKDPNAIIRSATLFDQRTQFIITFIKYIIGSIAVFMIIRSGLRLITSSGNEEKLAEDKKSLFYGIIGLLFIIMADSAVTNVFYKIDLSRYPSVGGAAPGFNAAQGVAELAGFTNLVVTIATPIAILMLLYAAFQYITSAGNEERQGKAKRLIFAVIVGILIMYAAFAIVSTVISGSFQGGVGTVTQPTGQ